MIDLFQALENSIGNVELIDDDLICDDIVKMKYFIKTLEGYVKLREKHLAEKTHNNNTILKNHSIEFKSSNLADNERLDKYFSELSPIEQSTYTRTVINYTKLKDDIKAREGVSNYTRYYTKRSNPRIDIKKNLVLK